MSVDDIFFLFFLGLPILLLFMLVLVNTCQRPED
jgi:hypothetical protein